MSRFIANKSGYLDTMKLSTRVSLSVSDIEKMKRKNEETKKKCEELAKEYTKITEEFNKTSKEIEKRLRAFEEDKTISNLLKEVDEIIYAKEAIIEKEKLDDELKKYPSMDGLIQYVNNVYGSYEKFKEKLKIVKENFEKLLFRFNDVENSLITKKPNKYSIGFFDRPLVSSSKPDPDNLKHNTHFNKQ